MEFFCEFTALCCSSAPIDAGFLLTRPKSIARRKEPFATQCLG